MWWGCHTIIINLNKPKIIYDIWRFPKMGILTNRPKIHNLSIETNGFGDPPILRKPIYIHIHCLHQQHKYDAYWKTFKKQKNDTFWYINVPAALDRYQFPSMMLKAIFFNMLGRITTLNGPSRPWGIANGYSRPVTEIHVHKIMLKKHNKTCPFCCLCSFPGIFFSLKKQRLYSTHLFVNPSSAPVSTPTLFITFSSPSSACPSKLDMAQVPF